MDRERHLTLALDEELGPGRLGFRGGGRYGVDVRTRPSVDHDLAVDEPLEPVLADERDALDVEALTQELDRPAAHDRHEREPGYERGERGACGG